MVVEEAMEVVVATEVEVVEVVAVRRRRRRRIIGITIIINRRLCVCPSGRTYPTFSRG